MYLKVHGVPSIVLDPFRVPLLPHCEVYIIIVSSQMSNLQTREVMTKVTWLEPGLDFKSSASKSVCVSHPCVEETVFDFREQNLFKLFLIKGDFLEGYSRDLENPMLEDIEIQEISLSSHFSVFFLSGISWALTFFSVFCSLTVACTGLWVTNMPVLTPRLRIQGPITDKLNLPLFQRIRTLKKQDAFLFPFLCN